MVNVKEGQYYYKPHRNMWGVWKGGKECNRVQMDDFICDFATKIQAKNFVYKMNNWEQNKEEEEYGTEQRTYEHRAAGED